MRSAATSTKLAITPALYSQLCRWRSCSELRAKLSTFSDRMGNTQGIRLRMAPPRKASNSMYNNVPAPVSPAAGVCRAGSAAARPGGSLALTLPALKSTVKYCTCGG